MADDLEKELDALRVALRQYGQHLVGCPSRDHPKAYKAGVVDPDCTCGFSEVVVSAEGDESLRRVIMRRGSNVRIDITNEAVSRHYGSMLGNMRRIATTRDRLDAAEDAHRQRRRGSKAEHDAALAEHDEAVRAGRDTLVSLGLDTE